MGEELADLVFTDPPYNVKVDGHVCCLGSVRHREFAFASGEMSRSQCVDLLRESPLVRHPIEREGQIQFDADKLPRVEDLEKDVVTADLFAPLPADSSQLRAVIASA